MNSKELLQAIRQEIERRIKVYDESIEKYAEKQRSIKVERDSWKWAECKSFLSFLDTLQVDEPKDVDEAAEKFARFYDNGTCDGIAQDCFKAGAEWMAKQGEKSKIPNREYYGN